MSRLRSESPRKVVLGLGDRPLAPAHLPPDPRQEVSLPPPILQVTYRALPAPPTPIWLSHQGREGPQVITGWGRGKTKRQGKGERRK